MELHFSYLFFSLGCFGGAAPEVVRWKKVYSSDRAKAPALGLQYLVVSLVYILFGGVLAGLLAGHTLGALYIGSSWPVLFSGGKTYLKQAVRKRGGFRGVESSERSAWQVFDESLFC